MKQQISQCNHPLFIPSAYPTLNCNVQSGKPAVELSFCSLPKSFCWNNLVVYRIPSLLLDEKNNLFPCSEKKSDTTKNDTHEHKVNSSDKDTKEKIISNKKNNEKRINEGNEFSPVNKE